MVAYNGETARVSPERVVLKPIPRPIRKGDVLDISDVILMGDESSGVPTTVRRNGLLQFIKTQDDTVMREAAKGPPCTVPWSRMRRDIFQLSALNAVLCLLPLP